VFCSVLSGRPRKRWIVDIEENMQIMGIIRWRKQYEEREGGGGEE
jgi:hypothetical protein